MGELYIAVLDCEVSQLAPPDSTAATENVPKPECCLIKVGDDSAQSSIPSNPAECARCWSVPGKQTLCTITVLLHDNVSNENEELGTAHVPIVSLRHSRGPVIDDWFHITVSPLSRSRHGSFLAARLHLLIHYRPEAQVSAEDLFALCRKGESLKSSPSAPPTFCERYEKLTGMSRGIVAGTGELEESPEPFETSTSNINISTFDMSESKPDVLLLTTELIGAAETEKSGAHPSVPFEVRTPRQKVPAPCGHSPRSPISLDAEDELLASAVLQEPLSSPPIELRETQKPSTDAKHLQLTQELQRHLCLVTRQAWEATLGCEDTCVELTSEISSLKEVVHEREETIQQLRESNSSPTQHCQALAVQLEKTQEAIALACRGSTPANSPEKGSANGPASLMHHSHSAAVLDQLARCADSTICLRETVLGFGEGSPLAVLRSEAQAHQDARRELLAEKEAMAHGMEQLRERMRGLQVDCERNADLARSSTAAHVSAEALLSVADDELCKLRGQLERARRQSAEHLSAQRQLQRELAAWDESFGVAVAVEQEAFAVVQDEHEQLERVAADLDRKLHAKSTEAKRVADANHRLADDLTALQEQLKDLGISEPSHQLETSSEMCVGLMTEITEAQERLGERLCCSQERLERLAQEQCRLQREIQKWQLATELCNRKAEQNKNEKPNWEMKLENAQMMCDQPIQELKKVIRALEDDLQDSRGKVEELQAQLTQSTERAARVQHFMDADIQSLRDVVSTKDEHLLKLQSKVQFLSGPTYVPTGSRHPDRLDDIVRQEFSKLGHQAPPLVRLGRSSTFLYRLQLLEARLVGNSVQFREIPAAADATTKGSDGAEDEKPKWMSPALLHSPEGKTPGVELDTSIYGASMLGASMLGAPRFGKAGGPITASPSSVDTDSVATRSPARVDLQSPPTSPRPFTPVGLSDVALRSPALPGGYGISSRASRSPGPDPRRGESSEFNPLGGSSSSQSAPTRANQPATLWPNSSFTEPIPSLSQGAANPFSSSSLWQGQRIPGMQTQGVPHIISARGNHGASNVRSVSPVGMSGAAMQISPRRMVLPRP